MEKGFRYGVDCYIWIVQFLKPKVEIRMTIDFYFSLMVTEKMMSCDLSQSNI